MRRLLVSTVAATAVIGAVLAGAPVAVLAQEVAVPAAAAQSEDARLAAFFEQAFQEQIALSPQTMTALGIKRDYDKLNDTTDAAAERALALSESQLARLNDEFNPQALEECPLKYEVVTEENAPEPNTRLWEPEDNRVPFLENWSNETFGEGADCA